MVDDRLMILGIFILTMLCFIALPSDSTEYHIEEKGKFKIRCLFKHKWIHYKTDYGTYGKWDHEKCKRCGSRRYHYW